MLPEPGAAANSYGANENGNTKNEPAYNLPVVEPGIGDLRVSVSAILIL